MKREFGKKMIEKLFALDVNLTHIVDTSVAYIPGHGTPTVILGGRNTNINRLSTVRTVMGIRGESSIPEDASQGIVWQAIVDQVQRPGSESQWVTVSNTARSQFATFPWSLTGGGAGSLLSELETGRRVPLKSIIRGDIGFASFAGQDDAFFAPPAWFRRIGVDSKLSLDPPTRFVLSTVE
jgi:hypothetical protein